MLRKVQSRVRRPSPGIALGFTVLLMALGAGAYAAVPGGNGDVTACVATGGQLTVIDAEAGETCRPSQTEVTLAGTESGKVANADNLDGRDSNEFLGVNDKAADADNLDGRDSNEFLGTNGKAADADKLDGLDSSLFAERLFAVVDEDGSVRAQRGLTNTTKAGSGFYSLFFGGRDVRQCAVVASLGNRNGAFAADRIISASKSLGGRVNILTQRFATGLGQTGSSSGFLAEDIAFDVQVLC